MKQQEYQGLKIGRTCVDFYIDEFIERFEQERLLKEAESEQDEANHKKRITAIQKLITKNISHFDYPVNTFCIRKESTIQKDTYRLCSSCNGSGSAKWFQICEKCKGWSFIKQYIDKKESKTLLSSLFKKQVYVR